MKEKRRINFMNDRHKGVLRAIGDIFPILKVGFVQGTFLPTLSEISWDSTQIYVMGCKKVLQYPRHRRN